MNNEEKIQIYICLKRQFTDPGLYKSERVYEWLFTNGFSPEKLGYTSYAKLCCDFPEVFAFQDDENSEFVLINDWDYAENYLSEEYFHPADNFFGTKDIILNDDIIEMTQQSLYALTKILGNNFTVQQMKNEVFRKFEEAKLSNKLQFFGDKYVFLIDYCSDGQPINGIITKNLNSYGKSLYFSFEKIRGLNGDKKPISTAAEIPEEDKKQIYAVLSSNFPSNKPLHMAAISKLLTDRGVDRTKYGYGKMKDFLSQMNFLDMKEIILGGVPQTLVTIRDFNYDKKRLGARLSPFGIQYPKSADFKNVWGKIPEGRLTDFCNLPVKPMSILEKFIEESGKKISYYELCDTLSEDFDSARKNKILNYYNGKLVFPCRYNKSDGSAVEITLKPSAYEGKEWFLYYVDTDIHEYKTAFSLDRLENFSFADDWSELLSDLAAMAIKEDWDFGGNSHNLFVLNSYLKYTLSRILHEKKLCVSSDMDFAAFNTGLVDKHYDDIFACFIPDENDKWKPVGFCTAFSSIYGKNLSEIFNPLPPRAVYFKKPEEMFFDFGRYLHIDYERLLLENIKNFPLDFLYEQLFDNSEARGIITKIRSRSAETEILYENIKEMIISNNRLSFRLQNCLKNSVEFAKKRVKCNFRNAIPAYYPERNSVSLLLLLALNDETVPDAAILLEISRLGSYQVQTVLTLSQAYVFARTVGKLSADWILPEQINDIENQCTKTDHTPV